MCKMLSILAKLTENLPEIKQTLGEQRWPTFVEQIQSHSKFFSDLEQTVIGGPKTAAEVERILAQRANDLLAPFIHE